MNVSLIKTIGLLLFFCGFLAISAKASPATVTVTKIADTADGACDADCSLREAITAAESGDTIVFSPLFNIPQIITLTSGQISINKNLTIAGTGTNLLTVSGNNASRIFRISENATVALSGMTLTGGRETTINNIFGGAITVINSTLTLTNMTLSQNTARYNGTNPPIVLGFGGAISSENSTLLIVNSTINNNNAQEGGGIYSRLGSVNITNSTVNNNTAEGIVGSERAQIFVSNTTISGNSGRAISRTSGSLSVINSIITNNGGGIGGGDSQSLLTIDHTIIRDNVSTAFAGASGGAVINHGTATISNTLISNNRVSDTGGGIFNTGTMHIINCAINNNRALRSGGGIYNSIGQLFLTNSTVSGNIADFGGGTITSPGGGIYNTSGGSSSGANLVLTNATIANNRATGNGGGLFHDSSGTVTVRNTIIAQNLAMGNAANVSGAVVSQGYNLIGNPAGSSGWSGADLLNSNPLLAPLANNGGGTLTHALMQNSPAINAGSNALAINPLTNRELFFDQRGAARFVGGTVDIGAYELNISSSPVTLGGKVLTVSGRGIYNARITLTDANGTVIYAQTNPFGYYRFVNILPGATYTINVIHKRHQFNSPLVMTVNDSRDDLNFIASL